MAKMIPVKELANGLNVRLDVDTDLVESIQEHGIKNPLLVYKIEGQWIVKEGHRRLAAALVLNLVEIPCAQVEAPAGQADAIIEQIVINTTQRPLSYLDAARAYLSLKEECSWSQVKIATTFGLTEPQVSIALATLRVHPKIQDAVNDGRLMPSAVESLLNLPMEIQDEIADTVIRARTVRKVQEIVTAEKKRRGLGQSKKQAKVVVTEDVDPMQLMAIVALEDAASNLALVEDTPITSPEMQIRGRQAVIKLLVTAIHLQEAMQ